MYSVAAVATFAGISADTPRGYEREGIIMP